MPELKLNRNLKNLCIATLDPYNYGGVLSMMEFVYSKTKEEGFSPYLVYNIVASLRNSDNDITLGKLLRGKRAKLFQEQFKGMRGIAIERILPELEFLNYILNLNKWREAILRGDIFFAVGGSNNCALPFVFLKKRFSIWIATTLYEDRIDRIKKGSLLRKIRDYLSLPFLLYFEKLIFKKAERILVLSGYTKNKIIEKYKIDESKIEITPFPIKTTEFYPLHYQKRKNNYLLFTGRINDERKNITLLLKVFSKIKVRYPYLKLKLIGENPNKKIKKLINELKINDSVEILENINRQDLLSFYQNALLFIVPSFQEGLCISALEALACGVPVISTKCGGPENFIINGQNGFLVTNNNEQEMIEAILKFLDLPQDQKRQMAKNARNFILENYSSDKIWPKFLKCFN